MFNFYYFSFKIFINVFDLLCVKANSREICEKIFFPSFFRKMLISAFLMRFKAYYLEKMRGDPQFSSNSPWNDRPFPHGPSLGFGNTFSIKEAQGLTLQ